MQSMNYFKSDTLGYFRSSLILIWNKNKKFQIVQISGRGFDPSLALRDEAMGVILINARSYFPLSELASIFTT